MLIRGLFANFKIPIWFRYDSILPKEELLEIITKIESHGFQVISITGDTARSNQKLAKDLSVSVEKPYFQNPCRPNAHIYWFFDACHLIKLVRNHLLDSGFFLQGVFTVQTSLTNFHPFGGID